MKHIPGAVDVHVQQAYDAPTLFMNIDRTRVQSVGLQARDVAQNVLVSLSSSFQTAPTFWLDPRNGINYNIAVQTPQYRVDSYQALQNTPVTAPSPNVPPQILANLVTTSHDFAAGSGFTLQRAADDQRLRFGGRAGSWSGFR